MKKIFTLLIISSWSILMAQLPVSHTPENKNVILEEVTGIECGSCPNGHLAAEQIYQSDPDNIFVISIQVYHVTPDYTTQYGGNISNLTGMSGIPNGMVNRHTFSGNAPGLNVGDWRNATQTILSQPSYLNVALQSSIDVNTRQMTVDVEVYYTGNSPQSTNYLNVAIVQNNIEGPQLNGDLNPAAMLPNGNYHHMHMLRDLITGQWGDPINTTTQGTLVQKHYTYTLPANINNVPLEFGDLEIIAFVNESHTEIINAAKSVILYQNLPYNDNVELSEIVYNDQICDHSMLRPKIKIKNKGSNVLSSMDINCTINGNAMPTYHWTGAIYPLEEKTIELPDYNYSLQNNNTIEVNITGINGTSDEDTTDNSKTENFTKTPYNQVGTNYTITIIQDENGPDITWELLDSSDNVITSGGPYPYLNNGNITEMREHQVTLSNYDCYQFVIHDSRGDGLGPAGGYSIAVTGASSNFLFVDGSSYKFEDRKFFTSAPTAAIDENTSNTIQIIPNPVTDTLKIENATNTDFIIYNTMGVEIRKFTNLPRYFTTNLSGLAKGIYLAKFVKNSKIVTKKLIVK